MSLGPKSNFIPVIYAGAKKKTKKDKNGNRKTIRRRSKKSRAKKVFGRGRLKQKTIRIKDPETEKAGKAFKDESKIMDSDTYDKVKNMSDKKIINNLKAFGFKDK